MPKFAPSYSMAICPLNLEDLIRKLAGTCTDAGFPGDNGFNSDHKLNKEVAEITKLIEKL